MRCVQYPFAGFKFHPISLFTWFYKSAMGILGSLSLILLFHRYMNKPTCLCYIGKETLGLYVITVFMADIHARIWHWDMNNLSTIYIISMLITLVELIVSLIAISVFKRNIILRKYFLGKK